MSLPLEGIRVLDFTRYIAGPLCTMYLAEWGADVIKIETPGTGDDTRSWEPIRDGLSGYYASFNRSKRSMTLNLKHPRAASVLEPLVRKSDVVVCNFSPGVAEKLGIDYATLRQWKDDLIYCDISGFGQTGPYRQRKGFDTIFQAMGGLMTLTGTGDGQPVKVGVPIGDYAGAFHATMSILVSLFKRERTGRGEYIDLSIFESVVSLLPLALAFLQFRGQAPKPRGTEHPGRVPSSAFATKDGGYVQVSVTDAQWFDFCRVVGIPDEVARDEKYATNAARLKHRQEVLAIIGEAVSRWNTKDLTARCMEAGIPCGEVNRLEDVLKDPQLAERDTFARFSDPFYVNGETGKPYRYIRYPSIFSGRRVEARGAPPKLGEHTEQVLRELLDKTDEEISEMRTDRLI